jgi:hypothetical protein
VAGRKQSTEMLEWPARLPGLDWLPAKYHGRKFKKIPWLVVIHSGSFSDNVAEYLHAPPDGRKVSTHFSWSRKGYFVQQVDLDTVAWWTPWRGMSEARGFAGRVGLTGARSASSCLGHGGRARGPWFSGTYCAHSLAI